MTRSDPDAATAAELAALGLLLALLFPLLALLLQAAARAATAMLSADTRSRAILRVLLITGFDPHESAGTVRGPHLAPALPGVPVWRESQRR
jgi:hypothetical protein